MGTAYFNGFSDGCIVGEFNEIPWQRMAEVARFDDGLIRFCAVLVLACTRLLKIFTSYSLLSERSDNAVFFPLISWMVVGRD